MAPSHQLLWRPTAAQRQQTSHHRFPSPNLKSPKPHFIRPIAAEGILSVVGNVDCAAPRIWQLLLVFMLLLHIIPPGLVWKGHDSQLHFIVHREDNSEPLITAKNSELQETVTPNKMPIPRSAAYSTCYFQTQQKSKVTVLVYWMCHKHMNCCWYFSKGSERHEQT